MKPLIKPALRGYVIFSFVLLGCTLNGCIVTLREALLMKQQGQKTSVALSYNDAYIASRTALRWSSDGTLEDHKDQGYVMSIAQNRYSRYSTYQRYVIIWLDSLSAKETELTILTSGMAANSGASSSNNYWETPSVWEVHHNINYAVAQMQAGKPLPIMLAPEDRFREPRLRGDR